MDDTLTPVVDTPVNLSFPEAMQAVIDGKRVARVAWGNVDYCLLKDGILTIFTTKEGDQLPAFHWWKINDGDMTNSDWIVLPSLN